MPRHVAVRQRENLPTTHVAETSPETEPDRLGATTPGRGTPLVPSPVAVQHGVTVTSRCVCLPFTSASQASQSSSAGRAWLPTEARAPAGACRGIAACSGLGRDPAAWVQGGAPCSSECPTSVGSIYSRRLPMPFHHRVSNTIAFTCGAGPRLDLRWASALAGPGPSGATDC